MCRIGLSLFLCLSLSPAGQVNAQSAPAPILHEFFSAEASAGPGESEQVFGSTGPSDPLGLGPDAPGARNGPLPNQRDTLLDRDTDREGWLNYFAVYDPTVAPFKRVGARDLVLQERGEPRLGIARVAVRRVGLERSGPVAGEPVFTGRIALDLEPDVLIPIPSVAPGMAIHRARTEPAVPHRFFRDGADNYFVRSSHQGVVALELEVSAPAHYFGGPLGVVGQVSEVPPYLRPDVPESFQPAADEAFEMMGLTSEMDVGQWVSVAAEYFRDFKPEPFPEDQRTEDIYRDILFGRRGVCRHRAFAFVVTLQAWGVPARYVYNEAHAFAEVYLPRYGWRRVDLGGGAEGLNVLNAQDRVLHAPAGGDPLPMPPRFRENYSQQVEREVARREETTQNAEADVESSSWSAFGEGERMSDLPGARPMADRPPDPVEPADDRTAVVVELLSSDTEVLRGESLRVSGRLTTAHGAPIAEQAVLVYLGPADERPEGRVVLVDVLFTAQTGRLAGAVQLPQSLPVGTWAVYLVFEGDEGHMAARSR